MIQGRDMDLTKPAPPQTLQLTPVRLPTSDLQQVDALVRTTGLKRSVVIRELIRRALSAVKSEQAAQEP